MSSIPATERLGTNHSTKHSDRESPVLLQGKEDMFERICYSSRTRRKRSEGAVKMWTKCPDGIYRLDCVLVNGHQRGKAQVEIGGSKYRLSIEGFGSFREPKTVKEINVILARHGLWPFRETSEPCPECLGKKFPNATIKNSISN